MDKELRQVLVGKFWTRFHELLDFIESLGWYVEYATEEYVDITDATETERYSLIIGSTGTTLWISDIKNNT